MRDSLAGAGDSGIDHMLRMVVDMTAPGILRKNPGNIRASAITWKGQIGESKGFVVFDTPHNGLRALAKNLLSYYRDHGLRTVTSIINRFAPPSENNTKAYILHVCDMMRVSDLEQLDLTKHVTLCALMSAIVWHECGQNPYSMRDLDDAIDDAMGIKNVKPITTQPGATA